MLARKPRCQVLSRCALLTFEGGGMRREDIEAHPGYHLPHSTIAHGRSFAVAWSNTPHRASETRKRRGTVGSLFERPLARELVGHDNIFPRVVVVPERGIPGLLRMRLGFGG